MWTVVRVSDGVWQKRRNLSAEHHCSVYRYASRNGLGHVLQYPPLGGNCIGPLELRLRRFGQGRKVTVSPLGLRIITDCLPLKSSARLASSASRVSVFRLRAFLARIMTLRGEKVLLVDPGYCLNAPVSARRSAAHAALLRHIFLAERAFLNNGSNICREQQNRDFAYLSKNAS